MSEEFKSYADDALDDLRKEQERKDLALTRKHDIHVRRLNNFKYVFNWFIGIVLGVVVIGILSYFIHGAAVKHYQKEYENNVIWNAQCEAAGGQVIFNDIGTDYDNVCYFGSGFSVPRGTAGS